MVQDQLVFILGASGDLGEATARRLAMEGYRHFLLQGNRNKARLEQLKKDLEKLGACCDLIFCDFSKREEAYEIVEMALKEHKTVDVLINFQGFSHSCLIQDLTDEMWQALAAVHLTATLRVTQMVGRGMLRQKSGAILNCTSIWGLKGAAMEVAYATLKTGIVGLTRSLAREWGPSGIRVNALAPGWIEGQMNQVYDADDAALFVEEVPLGRLGKPEDIAEAACFLVSDKASYITGQVLAVDGGYTI